MDEIFARIEELKARCARIEEAWIPAAQKKWALQDAFDEIEALEEELTQIDREMNQ